MGEKSSVAKKARKAVSMEVVDLAEDPTPAKSLTRKITNNIQTGENEPADFVVLDAWEPGQDSEESECFVWDAQPDASDTSEVPIYRSKFSAMMKEFDEKDNDLNKAGKKNSQVKNSCFNCLGNHMMSECPTPRNFNAINKNRREFMNKFGGFNKQNTRYHLGDDQVYAHLKPGSISNELRKALNLSEHQLPMHIYKMRHLGYPPAWLEEAKMSNSGMAMFGSKDEVSQTNIDSEEKYDISKIIEFPGFNVDPSPATKDEWRHLHSSPMSSRQSKAEMIEHLQHLNERKKRHSSPKPDLEDLIVIDQIEDDPLDEVKPTDDRDSPSLDDLETQKQLLMAELEGANNSMNCDSPTSLRVGEVKHIDLGTPILKSASPYSRIPAADNFSRGICDVINFENLPGTTGHYTRMNDVIHKLRKSTSSQDNIKTN